MKKYVVFIQCELGDRDNDFISHYSFFDTESDAINYGMKQVAELSEYPMNAGYSVYCILD